MWTLFLLQPPFKFLVNMTPRTQVNGLKILQGSSCVENQSYSLILVDQVILFPIFLPKDFWYWLSPDLSTSQVFSQKDCP